MVERKARDHRVERDGIRALEVLLDHVGHEEHGRHLIHADSLLSDLGRRCPREGVARACATRREVGGCTPNVKPGGC